ncbi:xanthine dehydrogenase family protein molybdopterin-binding subunit [Parasphingorhabdus pacifica]
MTDIVDARAMGSSPDRRDGVEKVTGAARYAFEQPVDDPVYVHAVRSTIARGRITAVDTTAAERVDGVVSALTHTNAPRLRSGADMEFWVLQDENVHYRGQYVAAVLADSPEVARHAAGLVEVHYEQFAHDVEFTPHHDGLYRPETGDPTSPSDTSDGDVEAELAASEVRLEATYTTPMEHNNPMEPHASVALWSPDEEDVLTLHDSTQGVFGVRNQLATSFGLDKRRVRVVSPYVGGGFGSKGSPHAHNVLAALAAKHVPGRPVKYALTRHEMFALVGYRTPTSQRIRIGADSDGRLTAISHDVVEQTARIKEFAEQSALSSRMMYAASARATTHRLAALDVPIPFWMRAPGKAPGMYAGECAMDELAIACDLDPIDLRLRNEPPVDPESGKPWSDRRLPDCLRRGAEIFGWYERDPAPGTRQDGRWLIGTGVASSTYPRSVIPGSRATVEFDGTGYVVSIGAADIGTGTWTALAQIAADALGCPLEQVRLEIGDSALPTASVEGGSSGLSSWGATVVAAARSFRDKFGTAPSEGDAVESAMPENPDEDAYSMSSFGAHFAEVRVDADTGEIRVPRMLGVFSIGRVINPKLVRSQLIGGMTMGLSMALHEHSVVDPRFGHVVNHDLAGYHIAAHADVKGIDAVCLSGDDPHSGPTGARGAGEIGIVGAAAAIANATHHATGLRVRGLPITPDKLLVA